MKMTEWFSAQLEREGPKTRRALERVPTGRDDWKPHEKSMPLGQLAVLVATMPSWVPMIVSRDDLELNPPAGSNPRPQVKCVPSDLMSALDSGLVEARNVLQTATEDHLMKPWRLMVSGQVVSEDPRYVVLRDTLMHWAHHRGQLTVYLRMNGVPIPSIYGPTADEHSFA